MIKQCTKNGILILIKMIEPTTSFIIAYRVVYGGKRIKLKLGKSIMFSKEEQKTHTGQTLRQKASPNYYYNAERAQVSDAVPHNDRRRDYKMERKNSERETYESSAAAIGETFASRRHSHRMSTGMLE